MRKCLLGFVIVALGFGGLASAQGDPNAPVMPKGPIIEAAIGAGFQCSRVMNAENYNCKAVVAPGANFMFAPKRGKFLVGPGVAMVTDGTSVVPAITINVGTLDSEISVGYTINKEGFVSFKVAGKVYSNPAKGN